jgi:cysteine desulfurase / selenocysteine lyase
MWSFAAAFGQLGAEPPRRWKEEAPLPPDFQELRRREFPDLEDRVHLDAAAWGPFPRRTRTEVESISRLRAQGGPVTPELFRERFARARAGASGLLGVPVREVGLAPNTTWGIQLAATLVGSGPPGRILYCHGEFPASVIPFLGLRERGFILEEIPSDALGRPQADRLLERISAAPDLRAVTLSVVQFATGVQLPLEPVVEACRDRDVFLALDAIQALGVLPLPPAALEADVIASGAQKWLLSPWGSGFCRVHPRHLDGPEMPTPPVVSWLGFESAQDFGTLLDYDPVPLPDARHFEPATLGLQDFAGMAASLELILEVGVEAIAGHVAQVQAPLVSWLKGKGEDGPNAPVTPVTPLEPEGRGGIVAFRSRNREAVAQRMAEAGITLSVREGMVRISPHLYSTRGEMERVVEILDDLH